MRSKAVEQKLSSAFANCFTASFRSLRIFLAKPIARYPVTGPNIFEKGFPKYFPPGEPESGAGKPLKEGRVYISAVAAVSDRRPDYGVRELAPALESGSELPQSKSGGQRPGLSKLGFEKEAEAPIS